MFARWRDVANIARARFFNEDDVFLFFSSSVELLGVFVLPQNQCGGILLPVKVESFYISRSKIILLFLLNIPSKGPLFPEGLQGEGSELSARRLYFGQLLFSTF